MYNRSVFARTPSVNGRTCLWNPLTLAHQPNVTIVCWVPSQAFREESLKRWSEKQRLKESEFLRWSVQVLTHKRAIYFFPAKSIYDAYTDSWIIAVLFWQPGQRNFALDTQRYEWLQCQSLHKECIFRNQTVVLLKSEDELSEMSHSAAAIPTASEITQLRVLCTSSLLQMPLPSLASGQ